MGAVFGALGDLGTEITDAEGNVLYGGLGTFLMIMIAFFFVDIFDTAGTLYGVGRMAGKLDENDELENANEAFMADAAGTTIGALMGTSTVTTYIESAAGIEEGGKTGLTAVVVGVLFLLGLFFADLFIAIPTFAVAPALIVIGAMMMRGIADINWNDMEIAVPAFLTISLMPFTYSIADGIAWGVISYVAIKIGVGKHDEILNNQILMAIFVLMSMFYLGPGDQSTFDWILDFLN
jgi:AGZA family xanthine/uracil permease-like MFS transporter